MSIEQEIHDLTAAINALTYAILAKPTPTQVDVHEIVSELTAAVEELPTVTDEALVITSNETATVASAAKEPVVTKEELQTQCLRMIRKDRAIKPRLQSWLKDRGSLSLENLDEQHLPAFQAFIAAVGSEVK